MTALSSQIITIRQAANTLILAVQCDIGDSSVTLSLFPGMSATQRNLATYLMETNGLILHTGAANKKAELDDSGEGGEERKEKVLGEMDALMQRSMT